MMTAFRCCPQKYWKEFVLGFRPPHICVDLHAGGCFATALEHVYRGVWEKPDVDLKTLSTMVTPRSCWRGATSKSPNRSAPARPATICGKPSSTTSTAGHPRGDYIPPYLNAEGKPTIEYSFAILGPTTTTKPGG